MVIFGHGARTTRWPSFAASKKRAAAISALLPLAATNSAAKRSVSRGLVWLANAVEQDRHRRPAIIGFYLSQIWYYERLYPLAFAAGALSRAMGILLVPRATGNVSRFSWNL